MKLLSFKNIFLIGLLFVTAWSCKKDYPDLDALKPEPVESDNEDTSLNNDFFVVYDTVITYDTTVIYDSSFLASDRTKWTVIDSSSVTGKTSDTAVNTGDRPFTNLFDGSKSSYYHSGYIPNTINFPIPHWAVIDMQRAQKINAFFYIGRTNGGPQKQTPELMDIYASNDSTALMSAFDSASTIIIKNQALPDFATQQSGDTVWIDNTNPVNPLDSFRYFRFEITKNYDNGDVSNFSELGIRLAQGNFVQDTIYTIKDTILTPLDTIYTR